MTRAQGAIEQVIRRRVADHPDETWLKWKADEVPWRDVLSNVQRVANGLLERRQYQEHPPRHEYVLTDLGRSLRPVIIALAAWGNGRLAPNARSMVLVDSETGVEAEPVLVDRASGRRVDGPDFVFSAGPAASKPFRDRYEGRPRPNGSARRSREPRTAMRGDR